MPRIKPPLGTHRLRLVFTVFHIGGPTLVGGDTLKLTEASEGLHPGDSRAHPEASRNKHPVKIHARCCRASVEGQVEPGRVQGLAACGRMAAGISPRFAGHWMAALHAFNSGTRKFQGCAGCFRLSTTTCTSRRCPHLLRWQSSLDGSLPEPDWLPVPRWEQRHSEEQSTGWACRGWSCLLHELFQGLIWNISCVHCNTR